MTVLLNEVSTDTSAPGIDPGTYGYGLLTWRVGDRYLTLGPLLGGLLELAVVLGAAVLVYRWRDGDSNPRTPPDDTDDDR